MDRRDHVDQADQVIAKRDALLAMIGQFSSCAVAFSGGVDSAVVAMAAHRALGTRSVAVTADSPSLADGELEQAVALAEHIGIRHRVIHTDEMQDPRYVRNNADRCYHCKSHLYEHLDQLCDQLQVATVLNGANLDDLGDYRPGLQAAREHRVRSPLAECECNKADVRALARHWQLPVWDKPAAPCLSSRLAYGQEVTPARLQMVDQAEQFLRAEGLGELRVRYHGGDLARIEVPASQLARLLDETLRGRLNARFRELGFRFVTLDLEGFRSGSLNQLVPLELPGKST